MYEPDEPDVDDDDYDDDGWGESFMNDMEEVNPDWVSGEESD